MQGTGTTEADAKPSLEDPATFTGGDDAEAEP